MQDFEIQIRNIKFLHINNVYIASICVAEVLCRAVIQESVITVTTKSSAFRMFKPIICRLPQVQRWVACNFF